MSSLPLLSLALRLQTRLEELRECGRISLLGRDLDIAGVVAIARSVARGSSSERRCLIIASEINAFLWLRTKKS